jgi:hypothetical protein
MEPVFRKFLTRPFAFISQVCGTIVRKVWPRLGDFGSLTVCPYCHLITSKYKALCLECGRSLNSGKPMTG